MKDLKELRYDSMYIDIARRVSEMSYARRLKVGCILVKEGRIISMGWNGTPKGFDNNCEDEIQYDGSLVGYGHETVLKTKPEVLHAESNLVTKLAASHESGKGSTLYLTHAPCMDCAKLIYQTGIVSLKYLNDYKSTDGVFFLKRCGVHVEKLELELEE